jgi:hypothetical protein
VRLFAVRLIAVFVIVLALSACGGSSAPGVLIQSDIPSYLGVKVNPQLRSQMLNELAPDHCQVSKTTVFNAPGVKVESNIGLLNNNPKGPEVSSSEVVCPSEVDAQGALAAYAKGWHARSIAGIEDEAVIGTLLPSQRNYILGWRQGFDLGIIFIASSPTDKRITPALAELLARRAAAG